MLDHRRPSGSSAHAAPAIPEALGGADNPATPHEYPPTHSKERRSSFSSLLHAPSYVTEALDQWQDKDAARGALYESRLEATFEDDDSDEQELEEDQDLERKSTRTSSVPPKPVDKKKGGEGPERDPFLVTWESTNSEHENPRTWPYWYKLRVLAFFATFSGVGPWASSMASPASDALHVYLGFDTSVERSLVIGIFLLAFAISPLISGPISETVGRRLVVLVCNAMYVFVPLTQLYRIQHRMRRRKDTRANDCPALFRWLF